MTDIVERLVSQGQDAFSKHYSLGMWKLCAEAAEKILRLRSLLEWKPIESAPKDGTKIDLLYPYPRGRTIDCFWMGEMGFGWVWRKPIWNGPELAPESEWQIGCYPNMEPTHWLPLPSPPLSIPKGGTT